MRNAVEQFLSVEIKTVNPKSLELKAVIFHKTLPNDQRQKL